MLNGLPRILIVRLSAIGDVIRVLPALHALRDTFPNGQIDWALEAKAADIVLGHPCVDQVLIFDRGAGTRQNFHHFRAFQQRVRANRYDLVLDFHGILKSGLLSWASRAKDRYAFSPPRGQEGSYLFANHRIKLVSNRLNRIEENLELCKAVGAKRHLLDVEVAVPEEVMADVEAFVRDTFHGNKVLVAVHAPVERPEKQWPVPHFAALTEHLLSDGRFDVLLTWGPGQRNVAEEVFGLCKRKPVIAPETPDLKHLAALLLVSGLYFGGDTGPMHLASAVGVPVVAVFGGTSPTKHAPLRPPVKVLYKGPEGAVENLPPARGQALLAQISPHEAYDACVSLAFGK